MTDQLSREEHEEKILFDAANLERRIAEARALRDAGASSEDIAAVEPSKEEVRMILQALRDPRAVAASTTTKRKAPALKNMSLGDLLSGDL